MGRSAVWTGIVAVLVAMLAGLARTKAVVAGGSYDATSWMIVLPGLLGAAAIVLGVIAVRTRTTGREVAAAGIGLGTFVVIGALIPIAVLLVR